MRKYLKASDILRDDRIFWEAIGKESEILFGKIDEIIRQHGLQYLSQHKFLLDKKVNK